MLAVAMLIAAVCELLYLRMCLNPIEFRAFQVSMHVCVTVCACMHVCVTS